MFIKNIISDFLEIPLEYLQDDALLSNLNIDSIDIFEILCELEIHYRLEIRNVENCVSLGDLIEMVNRSI
jgi:acyl carrier protein